MNSENKKKGVKKSTDAEEHEVKKEVLEEDEASVKKKRVTKVAIRREIPKEVNSLASTSSNPSKAKIKSEGDLSDGSLGSMSRDKEEKERIQKAKAELKLERQKKIDEDEKMSKAVVPKEVKTKRKHSKVSRSQVEEAVVGGSRRGLKARNRVSTI